MYLHDSTSKRCTYKILVPRKEFPQTLAASKTQARFKFQYNHFSPICIVFKNNLTEN